MDIIIGLLKPSEGYLLIDGIKLSQLPNWNRKIGYIPQNFYLFEQLKRNVAFGINEKNINIDKVNKAIEFAQLRDFVKSPIMVGNSRRQSRDYVVRWTKTKNYHSTSSLQ